jgi:hypothetical protein
MALMISARPKRVIRNGPGLLNRQLAMAVDFEPCT